MARRNSTLDVINVARDVQSSPAGVPLTPGLKHALLVLASYHPHVWPSQDRLAADMGVTRRQVNRRLSDLEATGLISRVRRPSSTAYLLRLEAMRQCGGCDIRSDATVQKSVTPRPHEEQEEQIEEYDDLTVEPSGWDDFNF